MVSGALVKSLACLCLFVGGAAMTMNSAAATVSTSAVVSQEEIGQQSVQVDPSAVGTVTGRILDMNSQPLNSDFGDVLVATQGIGVNRPAVPVEPDAFGVFTIPNVVPGNYRLAVTDRMTTRDDHFRPYSAPSFSVAAGETVELPDLKLSLRSAVEGTVTTVDGETDNIGRRIKMTNTVGEYWSSTVDQKTGYYRIMPVDGALGEYTLTAMSSSSKYLPAERTVRLTDGEIKRDQDLVLPISGSATGRLIGPNAEPSFFRDRWYVDVRDSNGQDVANARSYIHGSDGGYTVRGLDTGTYTFTYRWVGPCSATYRFAEVRDVHINAGQVTQLPDVLTDQKIPPVEPYRVKAVGEVESARLTWSSPADGSKYPATSWKVQQSSDSGRTWVDTNLSDVTVGQFDVEGTVSNLVPARTYIFRISQLNEFGSSFYSPASNEAVPLILPTPLPSPPPTPNAAQEDSKVAQAVPVGIPKTLKARHSRSLPRYTNAGTSISWKVTDPKVCNIKGGRLHAGKRVGICRVVGQAAGSPTTTSLTVSVKVRIRR